ncbi:hypothetical protein FV223_23065, partial [Methylobacterium sp. WL116]
MARSPRPGRPPASTVSPSRSRAPHPRSTRAAGKGARNRPARKVGARQSRNDNTDPIRREHRPAVHVRIVESGA